MHTYEHYDHIDSDPWFFHQEYLVEIVSGFIFLVVAIIFIVQGRIWKEFALKRKWSSRVVLFILLFPLGVGRFLTTYSLAILFHRLVLPDQ